MRFLTRELYDAIQPGSSTPFKEACRRWDERCAERREHIAAIRERLPESAQALADLTLHDGILEQAYQPSPRVVVLVIDASDNPWGPTGKFTLTFDGVDSVCGLEDLVGRIWLYEEVDLHGEGLFRFSILLTSAEFTVVAASVMIEEVPA